MENIKLQLVNYQQAEKLKKLGFDIRCWNYYDIHDTNSVYPSNLGYCFDHNSTFIEDGKEHDRKTLSAPETALAIRWIRDTKEIDCAVHINYKYNNYEFDRDDIQTELICNGYFGTIVNIGDTDVFETYEKAESALLDKLIEYLEK
jgi:hypothetical protein